MSPREALRVELLGDIVPSDAKIFLSGFAKALAAISDVTHGVCRQLNVLIQRETDKQRYQGVNVIELLYCLLPLDPSRPLLREPSRQVGESRLRKPFSQRLLVEHVKVVLRRYGVKDGAVPKETDAAKVLERGQLRMDPERHTCTWKNEPVTLTVTEFVILQALATRPGVVKSRNALMDAAYDDQVYVDDRTIDSHIKRLRKKLKQAEDSFDMIETLYGVGYRFKE
jgi:hypothetical protein